MMETASFTVALQCGGVTAELTVSSTRTELRNMQETLCQKFGERFPWRTATLHIGGKRYDGFGDMPFLGGAPEEPCFVKFEDTTDVYWIDMLFKNPTGNNTSLEDEMNPHGQQPMIVIPDFPAAA